MVLARSTIVQLLSLLGVVVTVGGFSSGPPSISDTRSAPGALRNITYGELVCSHLTPGHFTDLPQPQAGNGGFVVNATEIIDVLDGRYTPGESYRGKRDFGYASSMCILSSRGEHLGTYL